MSQEPQNPALDALTEETARQIIWTLQPGATADPLPAVKQLLYNYLDNAVNQLAQDAMREQGEEGTAAEQTWETEGGRPSDTH